MCPPPGPDQRPARPPLEPLPCAHLRAAADWGRGEGQPAGVGPEVFWCALTSRSCGPDGLFVHPDECHEARPCFDPPGGDGGPSSDPDAAARR